MKLIKKLSDGIGSEDGLLFFPEECETLAVNYVRIKDKERTMEDSHPDEEEIYVVLTGEGSVYLNQEAFPVRAGNVIYIPRNTAHFMEATEKKGLTYLCVANWPDKNR